MAATLIVIALVMILFFFAQKRLRGGRDTDGGEG